MNLKYRERCEDTEQALFTSGVIAMRIYTVTALYPSYTEWW